MMCLFRKTRIDFEKDHILSFWLSSLYVFYEYQNFENILRSDLNEGISGSGKRGKVTNEKSEWDL